MATIEELANKGLVPRITAELGADGASGRVSGRGAVRVSSLQPASAVVIGIGGTGIQIAARLQAAVDGDRPDQHGESAVQIIGIDAVDESNQSDTLPPGAHLRNGSLINLGGFDPGDFLKHNLGSDPALSSWWDADYTVASGAFTKGLRRERMLGRLFFYVKRSVIQAEIRKAMVRAMAITAGRPAGGASSIDVYVVGSSAGGTGSSGMLETLSAVHAAARELGGLQAKIRAMIVLPGVFGTIGGIDADVLQAQRANAYAYFKELDYFMVHGDQLASMMNWDGLDIAKDGLLQQAFLFDASMGTAGRISGARDVYEIAAEALYQFLLTESGQRLVGVAGVNREIYLGYIDAFDKPRRYCGLGLSRIVFPGDTMRSHLTMFWCFQMLQQGFGRPAMVGEPDALTKEKLHRVEDAVLALARRASTPGENRDRSALEDQGTRAPSNLKNRPESEYAGEIYDEIKSNLPRVQAELGRVLETMRVPLLEEARSAIEAAAFSSGESVPQALDLLQNFLRRLRRKSDVFESELFGAQSQLDAAQTAINQGRNALEIAEGRGALEALAGAVVGLFNRGRMSRDDAGEALGNAIRDWVSASVRLPIAESKKRYVDAVVAHVERCIAELTRAEERLVGMRELARAAYKRDELIGKDVGPVATTVLIPADVSPEVEYSQLSEAITKNIIDEYAHRLQGDSLQEFVDRWRRESGSRGFFDLGSENPTAARIAEMALLALLERDAERVAVADRLPADLVEAAALAGGSQVLDEAIRKLLMVSENVCWSFAPGRFRPSALAAGVVGGATPEVVTTISHHPSVAGLFAGQADSLVHFDDAERVVALSCQWAVPLHCLPVVSEWKADYTSLAAQRDADRGRTNRVNIEPPNHISKRFDALDEPVPEYFVLDNTSEVIAYGLIMSALVREARESDTDLASKLQRIFVSEAQIEPASPIFRDVDAGQWVVRPCKIEGTKVRPLGTTAEKRMGGGYIDLLRGLGADQPLAESVKQVWSCFRKGIGHDRVVQTIDTKILGPQGRLTRDEANADIDDIQYIHLLINAAGRIRTALLDD